MQTAGAGGYLQHYEYDGLNRLVKATGRDNTPYGDAQYSHYTMEMAYNAMSSPVKIEKNLNGTFIRNEYLYGLEEHPNAPQQVGETQYTYSKSGNPLTIEGTSTSRTLTWDAENRLRMMEDRRTGMLHLYTYNHAGERALKRFGTAQTVAVNGLRAAALLDVSENYSVYVSPYFVENSNRYTKHYYAGAMRIASKMGASGSTYAAGTDEPDLYFYHTDHLGSTTYITDRKEVAQYVAYTPYGETFKEYKNVTPYKFNGKELDQETGYYYYGARYYDPGTALWFGTDPLAHKYPMNSPYVYCNGNPISRIDYNGMDWYSVNNEDGTQSGKWFNSSEPTVSDGGQTYNHVGKTMSGFNADGSFVYGAQDGKLYNSAPLDEVTVNGNQSAMMTRSIHGAQNAFLTSDYTMMAVGLAGGMMAGPAVLEYGYNAAVWAAPYVKSAAIASYNAGRQAYTASSNAAKYYGSTAIINGVKGYGKAKAMAEIGYEIINNSSKLSFYTGLIDGFIKSFDFPPDTPYVIDNPIFSFGSDAMNGFIDILKKLVK